MQRVNATPRPSSFTSGRASRPEEAIPLLGGGAPKRIEALDDDQCLRFRHRVVGTSMIDAYRTDQSGKFIGEVATGECRDFTLGLLEVVATAGLAIYSPSTFRLEETRRSGFSCRSVGNGDRVKAIVLRAFQSSVWPIMISAVTDRSITPPLPALARQDAPNR